MTDAEIMDLWDLMGSWAKTFRREGADLIVPFARTLLAGAAGVEQPVAWRFQWRMKGDEVWTNNWQTQVCKPVFSENEPYEYLVEPLFTNHQSSNAQ